MGLTRDSLRLPRERMFVEIPAVLKILDKRLCQPLEVWEVDVAEVTRKRRKRRRRR